MVFTREGHTADIVAEYRPRSEIVAVTPTAHSAQRLALQWGLRPVVHPLPTNPTEAIEIARQKPPQYAVLDLRLEDGTGLSVVEELHRRRADCKVVMLTGYGNIATAVAAVKIGATDYLSKPADANDVTAALLARQRDKPPPPENPMSADRVRWEHIHRIFELCDRNVSETARRLSMHRRTLQRILSKRGPK